MYLQELGLHGNYESEVEFVAARRALSELATAGPGTIDAVREL